MQLFPTLALGFSLGVLHATDPDHVVAVATLVTERRGIRGALRVGAFWGVGHALTLLVIGGALVLLRWVVPPALEAAFELCVAAMLVWLGVRTLRRAAPDDHPGSTGLRGFMVGALHGLAGSAAVALAVLTQVEGVVEGLGYLVAFGAGTVLGMMVATGLIGVPLSLRVANERLHQMRQRWLRPVAGLASVVVGAVMVGKIGFVDGLFVP
jgi:hypothetical protein